MAKTTSDSILGVIRKESRVLLYSCNACAIMTLAIKSNLLTYSLTCII